MEYFLQSHFGAPLGLEACRAIKALRFTGCRIDAQKTTPTDLRTILAEVQAAGLKPLVIADSYSTLVDLPTGCDVEWMNEPNLKGITPEQYVQSLKDNAVETFGDLRFWMPAVSNLNVDGVYYLSEVLRVGVPAHAGISVHDYDDHDLTVFTSLIGTRPFAVTEFGYNAHRNRWKFWDPGLSDADAAEKIRQRWVKLAAQGATIGSLYQRLDGSGASDRFGIRRINGTLKPQAHTIP